jgi:hypothetical protein
MATLIMCALIRPQLGPLLRLPWKKTLDVILIAVAGLSLAWRSPIKGAAFMVVGFQLLAVASLLR